METNQCMGPFAKLSDHNTRYNTVNSCYSAWIWKQTVQLEHTLTRWTKRKCVLVEWLVIITICSFIEVPKSLLMAHSTCCITVRIYSYWVTNNKYRNELLQWPVTEWTQYCSGQLRNSIWPATCDLPFQKCEIEYFRSAFKFVKVQVEYTAAAMAREPIGANGGLMVVQSSFTGIWSMIWFALCGHTSVPRLREIGIWY